MQDQQAMWVQNPGDLSKWVEGWVQAAAEGLWSREGSAQIIGEAAEKLKNRFCTNGLWAPGAESAYSVLIDGADRAKAEGRKKRVQHRGQPSIRANSLGR